jgi:hypothetical protein
MEAVEVEMRKLTNIDARPASADIPEVADVAQADPKSLGSSVFFERPANQ